MSRFFRAGSDSETETESEEEVQQQRPAIPARAYQLSDDEEDARRIVRSEKDKRYEELRDIIKTLKNHKKIKDMASVLTDFESLGRAYDKARKVVDKEGIPRFYLRCLVELEDFVTESWEDREWRKTISKNNSKGLTTLRQKLKKYCRTFEEEMSHYRENPDEGEDEEEREEEEEDGRESKESDDEGEVEEIRPMKAAKFVGSDVESDEDEDSDDIWNQSSEDESSSSDDDLPVAGRLTAEYFLKTTTEQEAAKKEKKKKEKKKTDRRKADEEWQPVKGGAPLIVEKPKMFAKDQEINHEAVVKKLYEIVAARGKKGTDRSQMIDMLVELKNVSDANNLGPAMHVKILFNIMAAIFDYNPNIATCMRNEMWEMCLETMTTLMDMLTRREEINVGEKILEENENFETVPYRVRGCILTVMERVDEEFTKMLQACDAHSTEFVERLKDEQKVCKLLEDLEIYVEKHGTSEEICRCYLRRIEHLYFKFDPTAFDVPADKSVTSEKLMDKLCKFIYAKDLTDRLRTRAILCQIYHHALHDRWFQARDLMLMSHLQDNIQHSDVPTQILYNRTLVQLGLCAFRQGHVRDAHNALVDIQSSNRAKELLAQGLVPQRQHERTPEQEKIEKRRLLPYHMHINLELLECVYLVSAMLLEIPYMAAHELDVRRRMISKNFHHVMKMSERQTLTGPPESMREHVVAASKAMKAGDWRACKNFIINEKMNAKVWDLFHQADKVRDLIRSKIQEESLRTYLFCYSSVYDSISLPYLALMFELETPVVHSIISKMIIGEELMASLDEPSQVLSMHRTEPTRLQSLALQLAEKVASLVENNERIMEVKQGNFFFQKSSNQNYMQQNQNWGGGRRQNRQEGRYDRERSRNY
ncbi:eukaryotic translation initiation factor 3 subunit C-like isoform X2 [Pomacea canaliculata]|uniref:eukaryotic translation initiation factor 3 subunit C-like isoform X2 n=1 Tax=Pomacea canaliculata TaxID=400727 RepID=UPI000D733234|nr:eukaryotic translation initiation factor 3 subunit C-like isoform X2 [Pomacea canaliculata]